MSKLSDMKKAKEKAGRFGWLYNLLAIIFIVALVGLIYMAFFPGSPSFDMAKLESAGHHAGSPLAKVHIVEFSDFECPACGVAYGTLERVKQDFNSDIYLTYRHFPLSALHPFAQKAAEASECAAEQGKFWEMHGQLFENQQALAASDLRQYASGLGLDVDQFSSCLDSGKYAPIVASDYSAGIGVGVDSTPSFFINGKKYGNLTYEQFRSVIENAR